MRRRNERGAAVVEFAVVVPFLFLLLAGIIEFSTYYNTDLRLSNAAISAARVVATGGTQADATARARDALDRPGAAVAYQLTGGASGCVPGSNVTATIRSRESAVLGFFVDAVTLSGKGTVKCS